MACWTESSRRSINLGRCDGMRTRANRGWEEVRQFGAAAVIAVGLALGVGPQRAIAQEPPASGEAEPASPQGRPAGRHGPGPFGHGGPDEPGNRGRERSMWGRGMLEPSESDRLPLQPGEEEQLRAFVKEKLPNLSIALGWAEERNPGATRQGFAKLVPRLRQLRRIYAESPQRAELIEQHAANQVRVEMLRRAWLRAKDEARDSIESQMRQFVAKNVGLEADLLARWAEELQSGREARIADRVARLTQVDPDLAAEPGEIRQLAERLAAAQDDATRTELKAKLTTAVGRQLDHHIAAMRRRSEELRSDAPNVVDRRMHPLLQIPKPRDP
jgi:hypothetical protein